MTESPFVRSGAVVRCASCNNKFRIKSNYIERVVMTGPRTLDETDSVLRSDSVDIDPDEVAPVSIDDEGNVVGLSGLSELMRWSDAEGSKQKLKDRIDGDAQADEHAPAPPPATAIAPEVGVMPKMRPRRRRKKRNNQKLLLVMIGLLVAVGIGIVVIITSGDGNDSADNAKKTDDTQQDDKDAGTNNQPDPNAQANNGKDPKNGKGPKKPDNPEVIVLPTYPSPLREPSAFVKPWKDPDPTELSPDVPARLHTSDRLDFEGWYLTRPARKFTTQESVDDVELTALTVKTKDNKTTVLVGTIKNKTARTILSGEMHIMLLFNQEAVYAETFVRMVMVPPGQEQAITLPIKTREWRKKQFVRTRAKITAWSDKPVTALPGVNAEPAGQGGAAAVRVTAQYKGDKPLQNALVLVKAKDEQGRLVARYMITDVSVLVRKNEWLDLVVSTPLGEGKQAATWSAEVYPR